MLLAADMGSENRRAKEDYAKGNPQPGTVKDLGHCQGAIEQLKTSSGGMKPARTQQGRERRSAAEIKATALELLVPLDIERHDICQKPSWFLSQP